jgi:hypothetical protein
MKAAALIVAFLIIVPVLLLAGLGIYSRWMTPRGLGAAGGRLAPCSSSPNCVASSDGVGGAGAAGRAGGTGAAGAQALEPLR